MSIVTVSQQEQYFNDLTNDSQYSALRPSQPTWAAQSACRLLPFPTTIIVYYYYSAQKLIVHYYIRLTAFFQDNLHKSAPEQ